MAVPVISPDELASFHATHFSSSAADHFALHFLGPVEDEQYVEYEEEEEDSLGYYEDGKKRSLTDQQIAIFRHSEIQTLLRERRHTAEANEEEEEMEDTPPIIGPVQLRTISDEVLVKPEFEEGELEDDGFGNNSTSEAPTPTSQSSNKKQQNSKSKAKNGQRGKGRGHFKQAVKPDLRKRTWDVVEKGLGSLDYDEGSTSAAPTHAAQRRRITYDDD